MRTVTKIRRSRVRLAAGAVALSAALGTALVVAQVSTSPATSKAEAAPPQQELLTTGFLDKSTGAYFRIDLDKGSGDYGHFVVAIPGTGLSWARGTATVSPHAPSSTTLSFDGSGYLNEGAVLDGEFGVNYRPRGDISDVPVKLRGEVDGKHGTGTINVWVAGNHYHLAASPITSGAESAADQLATALAAQDWATVYGLADASLRADMTQAEFSTWVSGELGSGHVDEVTVTGDVTYTTTSTGISYANVPVRESVTLDGKQQTADATLVLIFNEGTWRWLTTK